MENTNFANEIKNEEGSTSIEAALISGFTMIFIYIISYFYILNIYSSGVESYSNMKDSSSLYSNAESRVGNYIRSDKSAVSVKDDERVIRVNHKTLGTPIRNEFKEWRQGSNLMKNQLIRDMLQARGGKERYEE